MRPIKLVIKGLNSFIEQQTIDFDKLTDRGLFGIFGPTGSGKSTILDGITLALYGDIARKSSNYINTNCNDLNVSFTFQISEGANHVYIVSRHFRRDKKTGNAKTHSASVKEITAEGEKVLAESATAVTKTCREILGLSLEDFTRTVVLPQGKFSEFLKLEGKQRREMLERLFNLQDYGERLGSRLSNQINAEKEKSNQLIGQLNTYEDISEDKLEEQRKELAKVSQELDKLKKQQTEVEAVYKQGEEVWNLQKEIREYKQRQQILEQQSERMKQEEEKLKKGESAQRINTLLVPYEERKNEFEVVTRENTQSEEKLKALSVDKEQAEAEYERLSRQKEKNLPELKNKMQQIKDLIEENQKVIRLESGDEAAKEQGIVQIIAGLKKLQKNIEGFKKQETVLTTEINELIQKINKMQSEEMSLTVDSKLRSRVEEGVRLSQDIRNKQEVYDKNRNSEQEILTAMQSIETELAKLKKKSAEESVYLGERIAAQEEYLKTVPVTGEELLKSQESLAAANEKWKRLGDINQQIEAVAKEEEVLKKQLSAKEEEVKQKKAAVEKLKAQLEDMKLEYYAFTLRGHLHDGTPCPVCGSLEHTAAAQPIEFSPQIEQLEAGLRREEGSLEEIAGAAADLKARLSAEQLSAARLQSEKKPLEDLFKESSLEKQTEKLQDLTEKLKVYEEGRVRLEEEINSLRENKNKLEAAVEKEQAISNERTGQFKKLREELIQQQSALEISKEKLKQLKEEVQTQDFDKISQEIREKDIEREKLIKLIAQHNEAREKMISERDMLQEKLNKYKTSFATGVAMFDQKQKSKQENLLKMGNRVKEIAGSKDEELPGVKQAIREILAYLQEEALLKAQLKGEAHYQSVEGRGECAEEISQQEIEGWHNSYPVLGTALNNWQIRLQQLMTIIQETVEQIEHSFAQVENKKNQIVLEHEEISKRVLKLQTRMTSLNEQLEKDFENLTAKLEEEKMTEEEVRQYLLTAEALETIRENINQYKTDCAELKGAVKAAETKLGDRKIEIEEWNKLQADKEEAGRAVEEVTKEFTNLTTLVKSIEQALEKLGKLREEKSRIDHKMAILSDLDKLFKGKRFVEFVAITRLKYISLEASKKLKEITGGNYGLEVDEDGRFIIRDYKNGGASRDASTLSGGETFLASLALALALSSEIQLKGTAPLELFFLDEGFGTLDDELLDVVMDSLEKIHHDKLKVGIISHVEAIKNRVPVKLLLTPAEAGRGGTKVRIERS